MEILCESTNYDDRTFTAMKRSVRSRQLSSKKFYKISEKPLTLTTRFTFNFP